MQTNDCVQLIGVTNGQFQAAKRMYPRASPAANDQEILISVLGTQTRFVHLQFFFRCQQEQ
jgi:hypothetical protein